MEMKFPVNILPTLLIPQLKYIHHKFRPWVHDWLLRRTSSSELVPRLAQRCMTVESVIRKRVVEETAPACNGMLTNPQQHEIYQFLTNINFSKCKHLAALPPCKILGGTPRKILDVAGVPGVVEG